MFNLAPRPELEKPGSTSVLKTASGRRPWHVLIFALSHDDVANGPILHEETCRVNVRRAPSARSVVVPQAALRSSAARPDPAGQIQHPAKLETRAEDDTRAVAGPGCTARSAVAQSLDCSRTIVTRATPHAGMAANAIASLQKTLKPQIVPERVSARVCEGVGLRGHELSSQGVDYSLGLTR